MKKYPLINYVGSYTQEILYETSNSALLGIPEALKNTTQKIYAQSKLNNEALYYLQVKTFLETLDLDEDEVSQFMQENPHNQRLGLEIFKILESTLLEKQAIMLAKTFKIYTSGHLSKQNFDKYTYIITRLNNHLIHLIEILFMMGKDFEPEMHETGNSLITAIGCGFKASFPSPNMDLVSFGFLEEKPNEQMYHKVACYQRT